jgi:hypothetical protein
VEHGRNAQIGERGVLQADGESEEDRELCHAEQMLVPGPPACAGAAARTPRVRCRLPQGLDEVDDGSPDRSGLGRRRAPRLAIASFSTEAARRVASPASASPATSPP